jgi:hypothetical protein
MSEKKIVMKKDDGKSIISKKIFLISISNHGSNRESLFKSLKYDLMHDIMCISFCLIITTQSSYFIKKHCFHSI